MPTFEPGAGVVAGREEGLAQRAEALGARKESIAGDERRRRDLRRGVLGRGGGDDHRVHQVAVIGRDHAGDRVAVGVSEEDRASAAEPPDHGRDVAGKIVEGDAFHRPRGGRYAARLRPQDPPTRSDQSLGHAVEVRAAVAAVGRQDDHRWPATVYVGVD